MHESMTPLASAMIAIVALTGCVDCYDLQVAVHERAPGEPVRVWRVGDTARVWAEAIEEPHPHGSDLCLHYASRPATSYPHEVWPDSFTFQSSRPDVASVTNQGLVAGLQTGEAAITTTSAGVRSPVLRITIQPASPLRVPPNMRLQLAGATTK